MIPRNTPLPTIPDAVTLQWANGKPVSRAPGSSARFLPFVGFHIEAGKDAELDAVARVAGLPQIEIKHQRSGGAEVVAHWYLGEAVDLLPITAGPVASTIPASLSNGLAKRTADAGIGLRWGEGERSKLAVRGFVRALWEAGYPRPVQLAVRSRMTDHLFAALLDHTRAATAADQLIDRQRYPDRQVSPAELWLPLVPGAEAEFGRGDTTTVTPLASGHPAELTADYLRTRWRSTTVIEAAIALWPLVKAWALDYAATGGEELEAPPAAAAEVSPTTEEPGLFEEPPPARRQTADEAMAAGSVGGTRRRRPTP